MSGYCFPFGDPGTGRFPSLLSLPNTPARSYFFTGPAFPSLKELHSSTKNSHDAVDILHPPHHHVQTAMGGRGHGFKGPLLGILPPPSSSPRFFLCFTFPVIATCVTVIKQNPLTCQDYKALKQLIKGGPGT